MCKRVFYFICPRPFVQGSRAEESAKSSGVPAGGWTFRRLQVLHFWQGAGPRLLAFIRVCLSHGAAGCVRVRVVEFKTREMSVPRTLARVRRAQRRGSGRKGRAGRTKNKWKINSPARQRVRNETRFSRANAQRYDSLFTGHRLLYYHGDFSILRAPRLASPARMRLPSPSPARLAR